MRTMRIVAHIRMYFQRYIHILYIYVYNTDVFMSAGLAYLWPLVCFGFKLLQAARESIYD